MCQSAELNILRKSVFLARDVKQRTLRNSGLVMEWDIMKILIILVDFLSSWKNSVTESVCGIHHWPRIRHFGLCCELFVFNWNSGSVRGSHEDFHVYLYTDSKKSAHTPTQWTQILPFIVYCIKLHSSLRWVTHS